MKVTNSTGVDLDVSSLQVTVKVGDTIDVDDIIAASLTAQGWKAATVKRSTQINQAESVETKED